MCTPKLLHAASHIKRGERGCVVNATKRRYVSEDTVLNVSNHETDFNSAQNIYEEITSRVEQDSSALAI